VCRRFGYPVVATGHQSDDNAEHVLMAVIRGSGPKGLSGIPPQREETDCRIIRPLLTVDRRQIISFLQAAKQPWVEDSSNRHLDFRRNRVRHRLLPMLQEEFNPAIAAGLNRLAGILRSEEQWIESIAGDHFQRCCQDRTDGRVTVDAAALECLPEAARRRVLRMAVAQSKGNLRRIALGHIDSLLALVRCGSGELHLPDRLHAVCRQGRLSLTVRSFALRQMPERRRDERPPQYRYQLEAAGRVHLPEAGRWLEAGSGEVPATETLRALPAMVACVDMDRAGFPLTVRSRLAGDRFQPLGMPAAQDLNRFMRSQKLTAMERAICPLVVSRGEIIWVGGCRIAEHAKIRSTTRRVLRLELSLAV
jgi:tRNA(Ile)-lysidine synthase